MIKQLFAIAIVLILIGVVSAETARITAYVVESPAPNQALGSNNTGQMVGNDSDSHGCIASAGYSWCESKGKCLRIWEENCTSLIENLNNELQKQKIYVLPETAAQRAIDVHNAKCVENTCSVEIKEIRVGNESRIAFMFNLEKPVKIFGFINANMKFESYIDAETNKLIIDKKPWWAFLAKE